MKTTFEITKEQIIELATCSNSIKVDYRLKDWFPQAFESELEVGKWYKNTTHEYIFCFNGRREDFSQYGFSCNKEWKTNLSAHERHSFILATDKEVETALIEEAKRRGFKEGVKYVLDGDKDIFYSFEYFNTKTNCLVVNSEDNNDVIFLEGKWAEIINEPLTLTIDEIAEKFGTTADKIKICK